MKNNKRIFISSLVTVVAAGSIGVGVAQASYNSNKNLRRDAIHRVVEKVQLHEKRSQLIDDKGKFFNAISLAHNFRKDGDLEKAQEVLENAGIEHFGKITDDKREHRLEIKDAIEAGDWDAYQNAVAGKKIAKTVNTKERFGVMQEIRALRRDGRWKESQAIAQEFGMK